MNCRPRSRDGRSSLEIVLEAASHRAFVILPLEIGAFVFSKRFSWGAA